MKRPGTALGGLQTVYEGGVVAGMTDAQLLARFIRGDGEGAASAFAVLVERHGPMVMRVCRASLGNEHDAEDAFQAVFLVLARRSKSVWVRDSLGPWLHAVAVRTSARLRTRIERRKRGERGLAMELNAEDGSRRIDADLVRTIHEEVGRLPDRFREVVVLCDLEGCSHEQAAGRLGWPIGTVKSRQARGRERLRQRLSRRGLAPADAVVASAMAPRPVPAASIIATIRAATDFTTGRGAAAGAVSAASALAREVARGMTMSLLKSSLYAVLALGAIGVGAVSVTRGMRAEDGRPPRQGPDGPPAVMVPAAPRPPAGSLLALRFAAAAGRDKADSPDYQWVKVDPSSTYALDGLITRKEGEDTLVALKPDPQNVTERDLASAKTEMDERGAPAISFVMTRDGARRLGELTRSHLPEDGGTFKHHLALIVRGVVVAMPMVFAEVRDAAIIEFGSQQKPGDTADVSRLLAEAAAYNAPPPTARAVKNRAEAVREAKDVDLPALEKADRVVVESIQNSYRWPLSDAQSVRQFVRALSPSDAPAQGGDLKAIVTFAKGDEALRTIWVREGGEWGFERPSASWTTGADAELWRLVEKRLPAPRQPLSALPPMPKSGD